MKYFSYRGYTLTLGNNLERAIFKFLCDNDRKIIEARSLEEFKEKIITGIEELNKEFNRCKPFKASWWKAGSEKDLNLSGITFTHFILYASIEEDNTSNKQVLIG